MSDMLMWPGLEHLHTYLINNKRLIKSYNVSTVPDVNSITYTKLENILDLFPEKQQQEAEQILFKIIKQNNFPKIITILNEKYVHISSLFAFLVVYPKCSAFESLRRILLNFLCNFGSGNCQGCGYQRRNCTCDTLGAMTIYDLPSNMQHSVPIKQSRFTQTNDDFINESIAKKDRRKSAQPKKRPRLSNSSSSMEPISNIETTPTINFQKKQSPKNVNSKSPMKKRKFPAVVFTKKKRVEQNLINIMVDNNHGADEEIVFPTSDDSSSSSNFSEDENNKSNDVKQIQTGHNLRPKKMKFSKNNFKVQIIAKEEERKRKKKERVNRQKLIENSPRKNRNFMKTKTTELSKNYRSIFAYDMKETAMSAGLEALAMAAEASQALQKNVPQISNKQIQNNILYSSKDKIVGKIKTEMKDYDYNESNFNHDDYFTENSQKCNNWGIIHGHGIIDSINGKIGKVYILRDPLTGGVVYKCMVYNCNVYLDTKHHADLHLQLHAEHGAKDMKCIKNGCSYTASVNKWFDILRHLKKIHNYNLVDNNRFGCILCGLQFSSKNELTNHFDYHYYNKYRCFYCQISCNTWERMKNHSTICNSEMYNDENDSSLFEVNCSDNDDGIVDNETVVKFTIKSMINKIEKSIIKEGEFMDIGKREKIELMKSVSSEDRYCLGCPYCHLVFRERNLYVVHIDSHIDNGAFECVLCKEDMISKTEKKIWSSWSELKKHYNRNHNTKPSFVCKSCKREFNHKGNYRDHLRRSGHFSGQEEPLKCEICAKGFYSQHALNLHHEYEHGGQARCQKCEFVADSKKLLRLHITSHHMERKYICDECSKTFLYHHQLKMHISKHKAQNNNNKKYKCRQCELQFSNTSDLRMHKLKVHRIGPIPRQIYQCENCSYSCTTKTMMELHNIDEHCGLDDDTQNIFPNKLANEITEAEEKYISRKKEMDIRSPSFSGRKRKKKMKPSASLLSPNITGNSNNFVPITKMEKKQLNVAKVEEKKHKKIVLETSARTRSYDENMFTKTNGTLAMVAQLKMKREHEEESYERSKFSGRRRSAVGNYKDMLSGKGLAREHSPPPIINPMNSIIQSSKKIRSKVIINKINDGISKKDNEKPKIKIFSCNNSDSVKNVEILTQNSTNLSSNGVTKQIFTPIAFSDHSYCNSGSNNNFYENETLFSETQQQHQCKSISPRSLNNRHTILAKSNKTVTPSFEEIINDVQQSATIPDKMDLLPLTNDEFDDIEQDLDEIELNDADLELFRQNFSQNSNNNNNGPNVVVQPVQCHIEENKVTIEQGDL